VIPRRRPLAALKGQTRELHHRAERYVRILDHDATIDDYARYLTAMLGFHAPVEELLAADPVLEAAGFAAGTRRKSHLLAHDLRCVAPSAGATPRCSALPVSSSTAHRLGVAYVIEGSTLGGKFILAHLPPGLAWLRGTATAFLAGYGVDTGARWRSFGAVVERVIATPDAEAAAVAGARETFARLIAWLARFERPDARRSAEAS
jgi:heme oxygenase